MYVKKTKSPLVPRSRKKAKTKNFVQLPEPPKNLKPLCLILDLQDDFLDKLESFPQDIREHKSLEDWVLIFSNINYENIGDTSFTAKLSEELLVKIGFREGSGAIKTLLKRSKLIPDHIDPIDAVERFLVDEFKYNPLLSKSYALPTSLDLIKVGYAKDVVHMTGLSLSEEGTIIEDPSARNQITKKRFQSVELLTENIMLFHGTDVYTAIDICENGIDVNRGCQKRDFSDGAGFYLTKKYKDAESWAFSQTQAPVVLGFIIPKTYLEKANKLDLTDQSKQGEWLEIITQNRRGKSTQKTRDLRRRYDFIEGPISAEEEGTTASGQIRKAKPGSHQLCIVNEDYADKISECSRMMIYLYGDEMYTPYTCYTSHAYIRETKSQ